jgi:hypothetical protein
MSCLPYGHSPAARYRPTDARATAGHAGFRGATRADIRSARSPSPTARQAPAPVSLSGICCPSGKATPLPVSNPSQTGTLGRDDAEHLCRAQDTTQHDITNVT